MISTQAVDDTAAMLAKGYRYGADRRKRTGSRCFRTRAMGRPAVCAIGEPAVRALYDPALFERGPVLPEPVRATLTGEGAVHTLDGLAHQRRKAVFVSAARRDLDDLTDHTAKAWDNAVGRWSRAEQVVLFDETASVLMAAACAWVGVPVTEVEARERARDMVALVDGFGSLARRHVRGRRARKRSEAWLERIVADLRRGRRTAKNNTALTDLAGFRDEDGELLPAWLVAVELLNIIRPTVAVAWYVTFAADAMRRLPLVRARLRTGDEAYLDAFVHEVRRFYPFAPYVAGHAIADVTLPELVVRRGSLLLIDVYGHHRDPQVWTDPNEFRPQRFEASPIGSYDLIPQGGGDPALGHRCPGEPPTIAILKTLVPRLAALEHTTPPQDMSISLRRIPAMLRSGYVLTAA